MDRTCWPISKPVTRSMTRDHDEAKAGAGDPVTGGRQDSQVARELGLPIPVHGAASEESSAVENQAAPSILGSAFELEFQWPMYVASIPESLFLGSDILDAQDLVVSSRKGLMVRNTWVACEVTWCPVRVQQVVIVNPKPLVVPPEHEMVGQVPLEPDQPQGCQDAVLEPLGKSKSKRCMSQSLAV